MRSYLSLIPDVYKRQIRSRPGMVFPDLLFYCGKDCRPFADYAWWR